MRNTFIFSIAVALAAIGLAAFGAQGNTSPYSDPSGDISSNIGGGNPGGGILDIIGMEVSNTETDISFKLTVNGDVGSTNWGKYMIGIATGKNDGMQNGNGWNRRFASPPNASIINLSLTNDPFASEVNGMNFWIGSWVDAAPPNPGVAQFWSWDGGNTGGGTDGAWQQGSNAAMSVAAGATSEMTYTVPLSSLGLAIGDTFYFDAYTSGGGDNDGAIDALANPNVTVNDWTNISYTSFSTDFSGPGLNSYTIVPIPEPSTIAMTVAAAATGGLLIRRRKRKA